MSGEQTCLFLFTHGDWGRSLLESAEMITGKIHQVYTFPLMPEDSLEQYMQRLEREIKGKDTAYILVLTDLLGGTPCNIAAAMGNRYSYQVLTNLSMEMLIAADTLRSQYHGEELAQKVLEKAVSNTLWMEKETIYGEHTTDSN